MNLDRWRVLPMPRRAAFSSPLPPGTFGYELRRLRMAAGLSQRQLAERVEAVVAESDDPVRMHQNQISSYEVGTTRHPRESVLRALDAALAQPRGTMHGFTGYPVSPKEARERMIPLPTGALVIPASRPKTVELGIKLLALPEDQMHFVIKLVDSLLHGLQMPAPKKPQRRSRMTVKRAVVKSAEQVTG